ncbi:single-stranded nucleic acid binding R3H [Choanephora cucurbitarum]|nr:single-stranded nucleic acid binding R3H [Choanephora cucurbitarum]
MSSHRDEQHRQQQQQQQRFLSNYNDPYAPYSLSQPLQQQQQQQQYTQAYLQNTPMYNNNSTTNSTVPYSHPYFQSTSQPYQASLPPQILYTTQPTIQEFNDPVVPTEPDQFIIDLLKKPQERLFLLKLELEFEGFIKDSSKLRLDLPNMNSYQRLMVHKLAPYYKLNHYHNAMRKGVYVCKTTITELPSIRLLDIDTNPETEADKPNANDPQPQFKIMRRSAGSNSPSSRNSSNTGEDSFKADRKNMTLEERRTAYEEARARIFQDLENK